MNARGHIKEATHTEQPHFLLVIPTPETIVTITGPELFQDPHQCKHMPPLLHAYALSLPSQSPVCLDAPASRSTRQPGDSRVRELCAADATYASGAGISQCQCGRERAERTATYIHLTRTQSRES